MDATFRQFVILTGVTLATEWRIRGVVGVNGTIKWSAWARDPADPDTGAPMLQADTLEILLKQCTAFEQGAKHAC